MEKLMTTIDHAAAPLDMLLFCPKCGMQHIDRSDMDKVPFRLRGLAWDNPPHRSHMCREVDGGCGTVWRPADVPTNGVACLATRGKADTWLVGDGALPVSRPWPAGLLERVKAAEQRVQDDRAPRSIPADPHGDVDLVLAEVRHLIEGKWPPFWIKDAGTAPAAATPAAQWREKGDPDPHGDRYDCERAALAMGKLTDDELANGVFLHGDGTHGRPPLELVIAGKAHMPIAWLTAAKDRIRWLSRALEKERARNAGVKGLDDAQL